MLLLEEKMQGKKQSERFLVFFLTLLTRFISFTADNLLLYIIAWLHVYMQNAAIWLAGLWDMDHL